MKKLFLAAAAMSVVMLAGQSDQSVQIRKVPVRPTSATSGVEMYRAYCAACHGLSGVGDGPAAAALKTAPADLTALKAKNGGKFPRLEFAEVLRGETEIHAHGSGDMPTWGPLFRSVDNGSTTIMDIRIANLRKYLESIQK